MLSDNWVKKFKTSLELQWSTGNQHEKRKWRNFPKFRQFLNLKQFPQYLQKGKMWKAVFHLQSSLKKPISLNWLRKLVFPAIMMLQPVTLSQNLKFFVFMMYFVALARMEAHPSHSVIHQWAEEMVVQCWISLERNLIWVCHRKTTLKAFKRLCNEEMAAV